MKDDNPCNGCVPPKRNIYCHANCKEYKDWKADLDKKNKEIRDKRKLENDLLSSIYRQKKSK